MEQGQLIFGIVIIVLLLGMAGFFGWRQWQTLRDLPLQVELSAEDRRYTRNQAWRRMLCSVLMVVLAALIGLSFYLQEPANQLGLQGQQNRERGDPRPLDPEQQRFFDIYWSFWGGTLLILLAIIVIAGIDFFAIRRYGRRHYRQIQADRRTMLENQIARIRSQRNGRE